MPAEDMEMLKLVEMLSGKKLFESVIYKHGNINGLRHSGPPELLL
jgi:hypothetical protein